LIEFYEELKENFEPEEANFGKSILNWIIAIDLHFETTEIWGLTSLYYLHLQNKDDWTAPVYVTLIPSVGDYHLKCHGEEAAQEGEAEYTERVAKTLEEAMIMLKIAMKESNGWPDSGELD
jgi:hypothetical protein